MARKRNQIVNRITVDIMDLAARFLGMNDDEIGAWMRKAVSDWNSGCTADDVDPLVKECYEKSLEAMQKRQDINAQNYLAHHRKTKALCSGKPNTISTNDKTAEVTTPSAGGSCATNYSLQEDSTRKDEDELTYAGNGALRNLEPSCRQNFTADVPTREDGKFKSDRGDSGYLESATSATKLATTLCPEASTDKTSKEGGDTREDSQDCKSGTPSLLPFTVTTTRNQLAGEITPESQDKTSLPVSLAGNAPASTSGVKKPYGTCGHVMLTDEEGHHLREVYGENLRIAIDILDAYIENGGKAAKKYKNHAAVMRKGNWVWEKVQKMVLDEKRIANADRSGKSFKQMERDREANLMHSSLFAPSIYGTDNKRIANG